MTYEEAKVIIENMREEAYFMSEFDALGVAKEAIEKVIKYRRHDLRKNPNDLPLHNGTFLCFMIDGKDRGQALGKFNLDTHSFSWRDVVAWEEIEPFE